MSHETYPEPLELPISAERDTVADLLEQACRALELDLATTRVELDRDLVVSIDCAPCGTRRAIMRPLQKVSHSDAVCGTCGQIARPQIVHAVEAGQELAQARLTELGIPPYDVLRIVSAAHEHVVLLGADRPRQLS